MVIQPDIYIGSLRIQEPTVSLTSFVVTAFAIIGFYKTRHAGNDSWIRLYRWFILFTGFACLFGGSLGHAFNYKFGIEAKFPSWITSMVAVAFGAQAALIRAKAYIGKAYNLLTALNIVQLVAFITVAVWFKNFVLVEIHSAVGLVLFVVLLEYLIYRRRQSKFSLAVMSGVGMLVFAVVFHILKISVTQWFTYFDFGHVFMILCLYCVWRGILRHGAAEQAALAQ